jgi:hypothetical protein
VLIFSSSAQLSLKLQKIFRFAQQPAVPIIKSPVHLTKKDNLKMYRIKTTLIAASSLVCLAAATADATPPQAEPATATYAQLHHCDWVGPGGRAVYRCNLESLSPQPVVVSQKPHRVCDWIGPGGRAVYMCRYQ